MLFGSPVKPGADGIRYYTIEDVKSIGRTVPVLQETVNPKIVIFLEFLKTQPGYETSVADLDKHIKDASEGLCFGYAVCFNAMRDNRMLRWWFQALAIVAHWDGNPESLRDVYHLSGAEHPVKMRQIFERVANYLFSYQKHFFNWSQNKVIAAEAREDLAYFEMLDSKGHVRKIQDVRTLVHLKFDLESFEQALDASCLATRSVIISGEVLIDAETRARGRHAAVIGYREGRWHFYDPSSKYSYDIEDKKAILSVALRQFIKIDQIQIYDLKGRVALTPQQREYSKFSHFLACWQEGWRYDDAHQYLLEYRDIKECIATQPKAVEAFFEQAFKKSSIASLSTWQRSIAVSCLVEIKEPSLQTQDLVMHLLAYEELYAIVNELSYLSITSKGLVKKIADVNPAGLSQILRFVGEENKTAILCALYEFYPESFWGLLRHPFEAGEDPFVKILKSKLSGDLEMIKKFLVSDAKGMHKIYQHIREYYLRADSSGRDLASYIVALCEPSKKAPVFSLWRHLIDRHPQQFLALISSILRDCGARYTCDLLLQSGDKILDRLYEKEPQVMREFDKLFAEAVNRKYRDRRLASIQYLSMLERLSPAYFAARHPKPAEPASAPVISAPVLRALEVVVGVRPPTKNAFMMFRHRQYAAAVKPVSESMPHKKGLVEALRESVGFAH